MYERSRVQGRMQTTRSHTQGGPERIRHLASPLPFDEIATPDGTASSFSIGPPGGHNLSKISIFPPERSHSIASPLAHPALQRTDTEQTDRAESVGLAPAQIGQAGGPLSPELGRRIQAKRGGGAALDNVTRTRLAGVFGGSFPDVHVHTDEESDALSRSVSALAFTAGNDVFFSQGTYQPESPTGRQLLAHELTHVVQQRGTGSGVPVQVGPVGDSHEQQADAVAQRFGTGEVEQIRSSATDVVQRDDAISSPAPPVAPMSSMSPDQQTSDQQREPSSDPQALAALLNQYRWTYNKVESYAGHHAEFAKMIGGGTTGENVVAWVAALGGGVTMPDFAMWDEPRDALAAAKSALKAKDVESVITNLKKADESLEKCITLFRQFEEGSNRGAESGAETSKKVFKVAEITEQISVGVLTGGASIWGEALAEGGLAVIEDSIDQRIAMSLEDQKEFNWTELIAKGTGGFAASFLTKLVSDPLSGFFKSHMGSYISQVLSDAELAEMGLERDALMTGVQKLTAEELAGIFPNLMLAGPVNFLSESIARGKPLPPEEAVKNLVADMGKDAVITFVKTVRAAR